MVFFLGNALFDVSAPCTEALLKKYDLEPDENCEATDIHESLFTELLENPNSLQSPGGSAANSSRIAQWLFNSWGEGQTTFVGCIGNDNLGKKFRHLLELSHVNTLCYVHETIPTGITAALVLKDGRRTLCAKLGAAAFFNPNFLSYPSVQKEMMKCNIIYVEGFFLSHHSSCMQEMAKYAKCHSKLFAVNLSAVYICENYFDVLNSCIASTDLLFGNRAEAEAFTKMCNIPQTCVEDCARAIATLPGPSRTVIITQGPDPVVVATGDSISCTIDKYSIPEVKQIGDTIGCGDAFVGGVLASLSLDKPLNKSIECGIYCATEIAQMRGCSLPHTVAEFKF